MLYTAPIFLGKGSIDALNLNSPTAIKTAMRLKMIKFINISDELPYKIFKNRYDDAVSANQSIVEAICISSYSSSNKEVNARFVNLKFVNEKEFIFFSNFNKASI